MKQSLDTRTKLLTQRPFSLMLELSIPAVLGMEVVGLYNMMDSIFVGQMVGSVQMGAVSVSYPFTLINAGSAAMLGVGSASVLSRAIGKKDEDTVKKIMGNLVAAVVILSVIYTVIGMVFTRQLLSLAGASDNILNYAEKYLRIIFAGSLFVNFFQSANMVIRGEGQLKKAMFIIASGAILNIILDPIFIFTLDMGVKGAAIATVLSQAVSAIWVLRFLTSRSASLPLERRHMRLQKKIVLSVVALGVSPFIMASTESLVGFVLNGSLKHFGDIYVSALAIMQSAMQFASVPLVGFAQGFIPVVSYNYGHANKDRVKQCFRIVVTFMFGFNFMLILFMILCPHLVASVFTEDEVLIETVSHVMPLFLAGMSIFGLQRACQNMFVALGQAKISIFIALLRKVILLVPLALILPHFWGVEGIFAAEAISDATAAVCCTALFAWQFPKILSRIKG